MSFRLKCSESVCHGALRLIRRELDKSIEQIEERSGDQNDIVHEIRKRLKKVRAALRLVRDGLGSKRYRLENRIFRDIARPLAAIRDAKVLCEALEKLTKAEDGIAKEKVEELRQRLRARRVAAGRALTETRDVVGATAAALRSARRQLRKWHIRGAGWSIIRKGLCRVYGAGQVAHRDSATEPTDAKLHEWRKQAKYFQHQLQILQKPLRRPLKWLLPLVEKLSQLLGDDHDLVMLHEAMLHEELGASDCRTEDAFEVLAAHIRHRRQMLQEEAFILGEQIYGDQPAKVLRILKTPWKRWRDRTKV